ncbi:MAG: hypothetical protein IPL46_16880 [Saprospiraceae bacterium]|nr:hypothetical protein [Saprospiraceae bacterium]
MEGIYYAHGRIVSSELRIKSDNQFEYFYRLGACQSTVYGKWELGEKILILTAEESFLEDPPGDLSPFYPRFDQFEWKKRRRGLRPTREIDTGCFKIDKLHRKM